MTNSRRTIFLISLLITLIFSFSFDIPTLEAATKEKKNRKKKETQKKKKKTSDKDQKGKKKKKKGKYILRKGFYKVKEGDNLRVIARRLNIPYSTLLRMNQKNLVRNRVKPGMKLVYVRKKKRVRFYGRLYNGSQLDSGDGYNVRNELYSWGTPSTVKLIKYVYGEMAKLYPDGTPALVCDLSRQNGGPLKGHVSHQIGIDGDFTIYKKNNQASSMSTATISNIDIRKNLDFLKILYNTKMIQYIFLDYSLQKILYESAKNYGWNDDMLSQMFQYPRRPGSRTGIIRHWRGHDDHYHIRFSNKPLDPGVFIYSPEETDDEEENDYQDDLNRNRNEQETDDATIAPDPFKTSSLGTPTSGRLLAGVPLENSNSYRFIYPEYIYTTPEIKSLLGKVFDDYKMSFGSTSPWLIGTLSKSGGGPIPGHIGHQNGQEIEIGFYKIGKQLEDFKILKSDEISPKENWYLIEKLISTGMVEAIFMDYDFQRIIYDFAKKSGTAQDKLKEYFQYPMGSDSMQGVIRTIPEKQGYFKVRFKSANLKK